MQEKVEAVIAQIRPQLLADGGDVELVEIKDGVVRLRLTGACAGCPMRSMTLQSGIKRFLQEKVPEVKDVVAI